MGVSATITLQLRTAAGPPEVWTTIPDVLAGPGVRLSYGLPGVGMEDRVAETGRLTFTVLNSEANSAGLVGYYTPNHPNHWVGWDIGAHVRMKVVYGSVTYYKFRGYIDSLDIAPGEHVAGGKRVVVNCVDFMDQVARATVRGLPAQLNKRGDEIFSTLVAGIPVQPPAIVAGFSVDTYPYALDNTQDESVSVMSEFQKLAMSGLDYIYTKGDPATGGALVYESRMRRGTRTSPVFTIDKSNLVALENSYTRDNVLNNIQVQIFPRRVDTDPTTVLFSLDNAPQLPPNTALVLTGAYRDPASGRSVRVGGLDMVTPVAVTDYLLNTAEDGSGVDVTSQLSITPAYAGNSVELLIVNAGPADGYLTKMQCRGRGIYYNDSVLFLANDAGSQAHYGDHVFRLDMPYQSSVLVGQDAAQLALALNKDALARVERATFVAQRNDGNMLAAIQREVSDRITISESVSNLGGEYFINGIEWEIAPSGLIRCSWKLTPADTVGYWVLESAGFSELGDTTVLGYGIFAPIWQLDVGSLGVDTYVSES